MGEIKVSDAELLTCNLGSIECLKPSARLHFEASEPHFVNEAILAGIYFLTKTPS